MIQAEFVRKNSPLVDLPRFCEVSAGTSPVDPIWHVQASPVTQFSRVMEIPAIHYHGKADWRLTAIGKRPYFNVRFWLANLILQEYDYFPNMGDKIWWDCRMLSITRVVIEPDGIWQQTNVWLGLVCECIIGPEGDVPGNDAPPPVTCGPGTMTGHAHCCH